jgi:hypothetical protein
MIKVQIKTNQLDLFLRYLNLQMISQWNVNNDLLIKNLLEIK